VHDHCIEFDASGPEESFSGWVFAVPAQSPARYRFAKFLRESKIMVACPPIRKTGPTSKPFD